MGARVGRALRRLLVRSIQRALLLGSFDASDIATTVRRARRLEHLDRLIARQQPAELSEGNGYEVGHIG